jgi:hypothetical protein
MKSKIQALTIVTMIRVEFPDKYNRQSEAEIDVMVNTWHECLEPYPFEMVREALINNFKSSNWQPRISNIVEQLDKILGIENISSEESFERLYILVSRYGSDKIGYEKACKIFTEVESRAITFENWKEWGQSDPNNITTLKAQYRSKYGTKQEEVKHNRLSNLDSKNILEMMNKNKLIE